MLIRLFFAITLLGIAVLSCNTKPKGTRSKKRPFPIINDSTLFLDSNKQINWYDDGNRREPIYIGPYSDTINLSPVVEWEVSAKVPIEGINVAPPEDRIKRKRLLPKKYGKYLSIRDSTKHFNTSFFEIEIDTSQTVFNKGKLAYPVLFKNINTDTVFVGLDSRILFTIKIKDTIGNWKKVWDGWNAPCGNEQTWIQLPPGEIAITSIPIKENGRRTEHLIKFGNSYSRRFYANY